MRTVKLELFLRGGSSVARALWGLKVIPSPEWILRLKGFTLDKVWFGGRIPSPEIIPSTQ